MASNSLVVAAGSMTDHANRNKLDLALAFMDVKVILLCDRSGSMTDTDVQEGEAYCARYQAEDRLVKKLQRKYEGKILLASFASQAKLHPNGTLPDPDGGTFMLEGLKLVLPYMTDDISLIVIGDGEPSDDKKAIINFAVVHYSGKLDTMYCGEAGSAGEKFMKQLASACLGQAAKDVLNNPLLLTDRVDQLLLQSGV